MGFSVPSHFPTSTAVLSALPGGKTTARLKDISSVSFSSTTDGGAGWKHVKPTKLLKRPPWDTRHEAGPGPLARKARSHSGGHAALRERRTKRSSLPPNAGPDTRPVPDPFLPPPPLAAPHPPAAVGWCCRCSACLYPPSPLSGRADPSPPLPSLRWLLGWPGSSPLVGPSCFPRALYSSPLSFFPLAFPPPTPSPPLSAQPQRGTKWPPSPQRAWGRMDTTSARPYAGPFIGGREARGAARCALRLCSESFRRRAEK